MDCIVSASTSKSADNLEVPIITKRPLTPNIQAPGNKAESIQYVKKSKHDFVSVNDQFVLIKYLRTSLNGHHCSYCVVFIPLRMSDQL